MSYINGRKNKFHYCMESDCNNKISYNNWLYGNQRCRSCAKKGNRNVNYHKSMSKVQREKLRKIRLKQYKECPEYKKKISKTFKKLYKLDKKFRERLKNNIIKAHRACKRSFNKSEKLLDNILQQLFSKEYKFVGDGQVIIGWFNPDFININGQKKIIELYGDYWHNRPEMKTRDGKRIGAYKK